VKKETGSLSKQTRTCEQELLLTPLLCESLQKDGAFAMSRNRFILATLAAAVGLLILPDRNAHTQESGMLAVVASDGNIVVYDADGRNPTPVTSDADPRQRIYQYPTWSTDGRLAFFGVSADPADPYRLGVFVQQRVAPEETPEVAYTSADDTFTYAYWSPGDCLASGSTSDSTGSCRDLAVLFTPRDGSGLAVRMIRDEGGTFTDRIIERGSPFYYSFSSDGSQMLWHRFMRQLEVYDIESGEITQLEDTPGQFASPMWNPADDRLLFGIANGAGTDVIVAEGEKRTEIAQNLAAPVSFAWSPDGTKIAYTSEFGGVVVTDDSGNVLANGSGDAVVAHFWSPQSDRIAYITLNRNEPARRNTSTNGNGVYASASNGTNGGTPVGQQENALNWYVLDVATGKEQWLVGFLPSRDMVYYLNFFDQFARSHSLWSPDGRYVAYGAVDQFGTAEVYIADTRKPSQPIRVAEGSLGIWSWR
jgi:TolB protein